MEAERTEALDTCEEAVQPQSEPPQPKPRKKKKVVKQTGNNSFLSGYSCVVYSVYRAKENQNFSVLIMSVRNSLQVWRAGLNGVPSGMNLTKQSTECLNFTGSSHWDTKFRCQKKICDFPLCLRSGTTWRHGCYRTLITCHVCNWCFTSFKLFFTIFTITHKLKI